MANSAQARKRARQGEKRRIQNAGRRSLFRTRIKQVLKAIEAGDKAAAENAYKSAVPVIDRMAGGGLLHKNKAARNKSSLAERIKSMASFLPPAWYCSTAIQARALRSRSGLSGVWSVCTALAAGMLGGGILPLRHCRT